MAKAIINGVVIAESNNTKRVEGNHYFPQEDVKMEYFTETDLHTVCPWKGTATYYTVSVNGESQQNAAWTYPETKSAASQIKGHVAFYKNKVTIEE